MRIPLRKYVFWITTLVAKDVADVSVKHIRIFGKFVAIQAYKVVDHASASEPRIVPSATTAPVARADSPAPAPAAPPHAAQNLVVLDSRVENGSELIAKLPPNTRLLVIDHNQDAVSAISSALASIGKVDSIQIFSHGASGQFTLGNQTFTSGNLMQMAAALGAWRNGDRHVSGRSDGQDDHERHRCQTSACRRLVRASRNIRMCRSTIAVREARA